MAAGAPDVEALRRFVELEARLIDDQAFDEWLALYAEDCLYWVPVSRAQQRPEDGVAHVRDDYQLMMARTHRLRNPRRYAAEPTPVTEHIVSSVRIENGAADGQGNGAGNGLVAVSSSQMVLEYRERDKFEEDQRVFAARVTHHLEPDGESWKIRMKRIDLANAGAPLNALALPF